MRLRSRAILSFYACQSSILMTMPITPAWSRGLERREAKKEGRLNDLPFPFFSKRLANYGELSIAQLK
jgi:hypothetical protein